MFATGTLPPAAPLSRSEVMQVVPHHSLFHENGCSQVQFSSVQTLSRVDSLWPHWSTPRLPCPSPTPGALLKLMSIELVVPSNRLILCHPLLLLPSIFPNIRVFSSESVLHIKWPKYCSFSFCSYCSPSKEYSCLIYFRMDWLDLLAAQGTLKSPPTPQFKSINSLALSFLYSPTLTSMHGDWKKKKKT